MQRFMKMLLAVLLAHLLGDFPLQSSSMVRAKHQGSRAYLAHGAIHLLVLVLYVAVFISFQWLTSLWFWIVQAVAKILRKEFEVIGFARDGQETLRAVIHLKPDVVVMDIIMPMLDGILRVARRLKEMNSPTKTVLLSGLEDQDYVEASLAAGAHGFVFKKRVVRDLSQSIHEVMAGRIFVSSRSRT